MGDTVDVPQVVSMLKSRAGKAIFQADQALRELYRTERVMEDNLTQLSESSSKVKIIIQQQFSKLSEILQHRQQMLVSRVEQEVRGRGKVCVQFLIQVTFSPPLLFVYVTEASGFGYKITGISPCMICPYC